MVTRMTRGLLAAFAASALVLVGLALFAGSASANPGALSLAADPASIEPGGTTTVSMSVTPTGSETVGGVTAGISYDEALLTATACTPASLCNLTFAPGVVGVALFDAAGLTGVEATVTFTSTGTEGTATVTVEAEDAGDCQDATATNITCTGGSVSITIATATASPTPAPTAAPTATPVVTPKVVPALGGPAGDSSSSTMTWLLAAAGLLVISGAAWATARARRVS